MKKLKLIPIALAVIIISALALTACAENPSSTPSIRWEDGESHTYNVSLLADKSSIGNKLYDEKTFNASLQLVNFSTTDEIKPTTTTGQFTTEISAVEGNWRYDTTLTINNTYNYGDANSAFVEQFVDTLSATDKQEIVVAESQDSVTFKITEKSSVIFNGSNASQTPISSNKTATKYYLGKINQSISRISYTCTYKDSVASVERTINGESFTFTSPMPKAYIDVSQILLYARSINQNVAFSSNTPTATIFDPYSGQTHLINMALSREYLHLLDNLAADHPYAVVNAMTLSSASHTLFALYNNPKDTMAAAVVLNKNTTVKFQSGMYVYELAQYTEEQVTQLKYTKSAS